MNNCCDPTPPKYVDCKGNPHAKNARIPSCQDLADAIAAIPTAAELCVAPGSFLYKDTNGCLAVDREIFCAWVAACTPSPTHCASLSLTSATGRVVGYAFQPGDVVDPAATVPLTSCGGETLGYLYPTSGSGHTLPMTNCLGGVIGYAANTNCAGQGVDEGGNPPGTYCASGKIETASGVTTGFMYQTGDSVDPAATVPVTSCGGAPLGHIYPTSGTGHTIAMTDCNGSVVGYALNTSCTGGAPGVVVPPVVLSADVRALLTVNVGPVVSPWDGTSSVGKPADYTAVVSNGGPAAADGTQVRLALPTGVATTNILITYTGGASGPASVPVSSNPAFTVTALPPGGEVTVQTHGVTTATGSLMAAVLATTPAGVTDPQAANNSATMTFRSI